MANNWNADIFISVHINAFTNTSANGIETYHFNGAMNQRNQNSRSLATSIQSRTVQRVGLADRGVRQANFAVLRETNMPAVLAEIGFISNSRDRTRIASNAGRADAATGLYLGVLDYFRSQGHFVPANLFNRSAN